MMPAHAALARVLQPSQATEFARDMVACLEHKPHQISPKYFYDAAGSRLFERICDLPEYYVTRTELEILGRDVNAMAASIGAEAEVIEFGAGSLVKARLLLKALKNPRRFIAIDISAEHLHAAAAQLQREFPAVEIIPLVGDFSALDDLPPLPPVLTPGRRVGFFPGSTLGNFSPAAAAQFLRGAARLLKGGGLLIGIDLVKAPALLHQAYNDSAGITAAFNLNLLERANRELGADFKPAAFAHHAFYHPLLQRIEMHLVCMEEQRIHLDGRHFVLHQGESMHTESSQKYTLDGFAALARTAGFSPQAVWCDPARLFSVHWLAAAPPI